MSTNHVLRVNLHCLLTLVEVTNSAYTEFEVYSSNLVKDVHDQLGKQKIPYGVFLQIQSAHLHVNELVLY